jgi:hypothetical protein
VKSSQEPLALYQQEIFLRMEKEEGFPRGSGPSENLVILKVGHNFVSLKKLRNFREN